MAFHCQKCHVVFEKSKWRNSHEEQCNGQQQMQKRLSLMTNYKLYAVEEQILKNLIQTGWRFTIAQYQHLGGHNNSSKIGANISSPTSHFELITSLHERLCDMLNTDFDAHVLPAKIKNRASICNMWLNMHSIRSGERIAISGYNVDIEERKVWFAHVEKFVMVGEIDSERTRDVLMVRYFEDAKKDGGLKISVDVFAQERLQDIEVACLREEGRFCCTGSCFMQGRCVLYIANREKE